MLDEPAKWKPSELPQIHTADPVSTMGRKSCQYTLFKYSVQAQLSAYTDWISCMHLVQFPWLLFCGHIYTNHSTMALLQCGGSPSYIKIKIDNTLQGKVLNPIGFRGLLYVYIPFLWFTLAVLFSKQLVSRYSCFIMHFFKLALGELFITQGCVFYIYYKISHVLEFIVTWTNDLLLKRGFFQKQCFKFQSFSSH